MPHVQTRAITILACAVCATGIAVRVTPLAAQGTDTLPAALASAAQMTWVPAAASTVAPMHRSIALELSQASLAGALDQIAARANVQVWYERRKLPLTRVSLRVAKMSVADALGEVLQGTGLQAFVSLDGKDVLVQQRPGGRSVFTLQARGIITGRVTDAGAGEPVGDVTITVVGTALGARTQSNGTYRIVGTAPGTYRVSARRVGYTSLTKAVTVVADSAVVVDFALAAAAATLDEVVTTGAGPQRRIELGNAITTINADSVTRLAPVTDITDLLSGRAASVNIVSGTGMVGDGPAIRIRGRSSITASNDPIVFVDGVRTDATPGGVRDVFTNVSNSPTPSALNDLDPNEIESIEILRGPSAATEYGTDAANGVIVIKTKRGQAGPPRWDFGTEQGITTMPATFPLNYTSWGHTTDGTNTPTFCPTVNSFGGPGRFAQTCVVDSITTWQPLDHSETSLFGTGGRHVYNLQFSEGTPRVRYFAAGNVSDELGVLRMPPSEQLRVLREQGSAIPGTERYPNALRQVNLRGQATGTVGNTADVSISTAYLSTTQRSPDALNAINGALLGAGYRDSLSGYSGLGSAFGAPGSLFAVRASGTTRRFTGGLSTSWRPAEWLTFRGTTGVDDSHRSDETLLAPGTDQALATYWPGGYRGTGTYRIGVYTVDIGGVASASLGPRVGAKTAAGVQYYDTRNNGTAIGVTNLGIGNPTLNGGTVTLNSILERADEEVTLGTYVDETLSFADQLYVTGAVRLDAGSGFGKQYNSAVYPKASISWALSQEPHNLLRLRAAYGQSGVQPQPGAALRLYAPGQTFIDGAPTSGDTVASFGNGHLRPERSSELEAGADIGVLGNRLTFEVTGYVKTTTDALVSAPMPSSLGGGSLQENLGEVRNRGIEASVTGHPIDGRLIAWDFTLAGSVSDNKLVTLGQGVLPIDESFLYINPYRQTPGYPLYGLWALPLRYGDTNHDGLIEPNEVAVGDSATFQGTSLPTRQVSLNTGLSLLNHRFRLSAQIDHRGGQKLSNAIAFLHGDYSGAYGGQALNSPTGVPLWEQARAVALASIGNFRPNSGTIEDASFTRWRELSLAYFMPEHLAAALRVRSASVTLAVRNLVLWTRYTGLDPEVSNSVFPASLAGPPSTLTNHDIVGDYGALPLTRYWVLKLAVGL